MKNMSLVIGGAIGAIAIAALVYMIYSTPQERPASQEQPRNVQIEPVVERYGSTTDVVHDTRTMMEVNSYTISDSIDNLQTGSSPEANFLLVDLSVRSIDHILPLSPNTFKLKTDIGDIAPSSVTSSIDAGLKRVYVSEGQTVRAFLVFESPSFGETPAVLEYSDGTSFFSITLDQAGSLQSKLISETKPAYTAGENMKDGPLSLKAGVSAVDIGEYVPRQGNDAYKVSLLFQNEGNSTVRIDPSYVFIQDDRLYVYRVNEPATSNLPSSLITTDLLPGSSAAGDVIIEVPKESTGLTLMYSGPNNFFIARIP